MNPILGQTPEILLQSGHKQGIRSIALSPSGRFIASGSIEGTIKIWETGTGRLFSSISGHLSGVNVLIWSDNDSLMISAGEEGLYYLWDPIKGRNADPSQAGKFRIMGEDDEYPTGVLFGFQDSLPTLVKPQLFPSYYTPELRRSVPIDPAEFLASENHSILSLNGALFLFDSARSVIQYDYDSSETFHFLIPANRLRNIRLDEAIQKWQKISGRNLFREGCKHFVKSRDNELVALVRQNIIEIWSLAQGIKLREIDPLQKQGGIRQTIVREDSKEIIFLSGKGIFSWSLDSLPRLNTLLIADSINTIAYSHSDSLIAIGFQGKKEISFLRVPSKQPAGSLDLNYVPEELAYSPEGMFLAVSAKHSLQVYSTATNKLLATLGKERTLTNDPEYYSWWKNLRFSPDGQYFSAVNFTDDAHGHAEIWETSSWKPFSSIHSTSGISSILKEISFSPDNKYIIGSGKILTGDFWGKFGAIWPVKSGYNAEDALFYFDHSTTRINNYGQEIHPLFTPDRQSILMNTDGNELLVWNFNEAEWKADWEEGEREPIKNIDVTSRIDALHVGKKEKKVFVSLQNGNIQIWDLDNGVPTLSLIASGPEDYILITNRNYYHSNRAGNATVSFKVGEKVFPFEQFDLKYNRPDIVLQQLESADSLLIRSFRAAYTKRLEKMHFTEEMLSDNFHIPVMEIRTESIPNAVTTARFPVSVRAFDTQYKLDRINVFINDVPVYGINGIDLRRLDTQAFEQEIDLVLNRRENKVQFSVLNQAGAESLRQTLYIRNESPERKPNLYLIAMGVSEFENPAMNLLYADDDAAGISDLFRSKNEVYDQVFIHTLINKEVTVESVRRLRQHLLQSQVDDCVILFYAGHGVLDEKLDYYFPSYHTDFTQVSLTGIPYEALEQLLDGIPARQKLILVDACHSGELDKENIVLKAGKSTTDGQVKFRSFGSNRDYKHLGLENSFELMKELFVDLRRGTGASVISSASGVEFAMEGAKWRNGVFTYTLLKGLRERKADLDGDGQIKISELQRYLVREVQELTKNNQRPTMRTENISNDWRLW